MNLLALGVLSFTIVFFPVSQGLAASNCDPWIAEVVSVQGHIEAKGHAQTHWLPVQLNDTYCAGDSIRTTLHSRAGLLLRNQTVLRLDQGTAIVLPEFKPERPAWLELIRGAAHIISNIPYKLKVNTPFVNAAIEGTEFAMRVTEQDTRTWVFEGNVVTENTHGRLSLNSGEASVTKAGQAPVPLIVIKPRDAVQWALFYPPIIDYRPAASPDPYTQPALDLYRSGQTAKAIASLENIPHKLQDTHYFTLRAGLLLSVGRVAQARDDIHQAQTLQADNGTALALLSIINLAQNDKQQALGLALEAARKDPQSPTPQVALSYVYQAAFDIEKARDSTKQALELSAEDPLAWARLSELELSLGELDNALEAAEKASALNPALSRTQMVLGFAYLTKIDLDEASQAFKKAIELDPAAPLPRFGQGLAKLRRGDVKEGTKDIEVAAILDPDNSLIRSYLGKAYYEEKREGVASREFAIAKQLDAKDPTPWFYEAILKQSENRQVEALHDMQKAIELNDNRAVYRSRLQLDDDLAARSVSLGRIYRDLGFEQRVLIEGWKSVNTQPSNYSAHRLLADSYSTLGRHEIARVSELLQSQLLQPVNITPLQPQLAESDLFMMEVAGSSSASFNEFNPLFARNKFSLQTGGIAGSNNTFGDDVVLSGVLGKFSFSLGQFHFNTDGFRENNDLKYDIYNIFLQGNLSPATNIQAEFRHLDSEQGDRKLNFLPEDFSSSLRERRRSKSARLGFHHKVSPNSEFLSVLSYRDSFFSKRSIIPNLPQPSNIPPSAIPAPATPSSNRVPSDIALVEVPLSIHFTGKARQKGFQIESQHLFQATFLNAVSGIGYFDANDKKEAGFVGDLHPREGDIHHFNFYTYLHWKLFANSIITTALSGDLFEQELSSLKKSGLNPKFGLVWDITTDTTLRLAAFKTLKRSLVSNQTIEPTQVAGFNQFYDDNNATKSWRYGAAIDYKIDSNVFSGLEISRRNLDIPLKDSLVASWNESLVRAYVFFTFKPYFSISTKYEYELFDRAELPFNNFRRLETHRVPFMISFNHPSGLGVTGKATYINQTGNFKTSSDNFTNGSERTTIIDFKLRYRLPNRIGLIRFSVQNIFDEQFRLQQDVDPTKPTRPDMEPERQFFVRALFSF